MKLDLNLWRVFAALIEQRGVGRAADRLGLTQSAVSHALGRLRAQLGDPLFVRTRAGLVPTPRALELAPDVARALAMLSDAAAPARFDPATTPRAFAISASSYFCATLLPIFVRRARALAPVARFRVLAAGPEPFADLATGRVDLALGTFPAHPPDLARAPLLDERLVWVAREGTDFAELAARPRLAFTWSGAGPTSPSGSIEQRIEVPPGGPGGAAVPLTVHDPLSAIAFVRDSDLVALIPRQIALRLTNRQGIALREADDQAPIPLAMLWHGRAEADPAHLWLRARMAEAAAELA